MKLLITTTLLILSAALLIAASNNDDLDMLYNYWNQPAATSGAAPHQWSDLERNLSPESCAQCHVEQFDAWKNSLHAQAFSPGLIGQFPHMDVESSNDCLACHAPLAEQQFNTPQHINAAVLEKLKRPQGFDRNANPDTPKPALRHAGVTCAACHVRGWQRFGPPQRGTGKIGKVSGPAHNGFTGLKVFETSQFCASCHQFPQEYAVNGKPLENTLSEWQQSRFAREGVQCQSCHMPDRQHLFKGIHDPAMVRKGLDFQTHLSQQTATLKMKSVWIGHAFPTYATPKVEVFIRAENAQGSIVAEKKWTISRIVEYDDEQGWVEKSDTRLMPDETRIFALSPLPQEAHTIHFRVEVTPDHFYKGVYRELLAQDMQPNAGKLIQRATHTANRNDYTLFAQSKIITQP